MGLRRGPEVGLDAQVDGHARPANQAPPRPASCGRLGDLAQAEDAGVERPGRVLAAGRHAELDVVDRRPGATGPPAGPRGASPSPARRRGAATRARARSGRRPGPDDRRAVVAVMALVRVLDGRGLGRRRPRGPCATSRDARRAAARRTAAGRRAGRIGTGTGRGTRRRSAKQSPTAAASPSAQPAAARSSSAWNSSRVTRSCPRGAVRRRRSSVAAAFGLRPVGVRERSSAPATPRCRSRPRVVVRLERLLGRPVRLRDVDEVDPDAVPERRPAAHPVDEDVGRLEGRGRPPGGAPSSARGPASASSLSRPGRSR